MDTHTHIHTQVVVAMAAAADRAGGAMDDGGVGQKVAEAIAQVRNVYT